MNTIVKTGIVLTLDGLHTNEIEHLVRNQYVSAFRRDDGTYGLHGDMHIVGLCAIIYMPREQADIWPKVHGTLSVMGKFFFRKGEPFNVLVVESQRIAVERNSLHELDLEVFVRAGGRVRV